jgi:hypothetical protein
MKSWLARLHKALSHRLCRCICIGHIIWPSSTIGEVLAYDNTYGGFRIVEHTEPRDAKSMCTPFVG